MAGPLSLRAKLLTLLVSSTLTIGVLAVIGELAARHRERNRETVPGTMSMLFYRHARLRHALVRDNDYFGWVHVGSSGFRGRDTIGHGKSPGTFRIIVDGGSTTFDTFVSGDEHAWPARLQHWLNRLAPEQSVEVINAGVPGYRVQDNLMRLLSELESYEPDLLIQLQGHNDLYAALATQSCDDVPSGKTPGAVPVITPWRHWLEQHSLLYNKLLGRLQAIPGMARRRSQTRSAPPNFAARLDCAARWFDRDLRAYLAVAGTLRIPVVLIEPVHIGDGDETDPSIRAMWSKALPAVAPDIVLNGYRRYTEIARQAALESGSTFISTESFALQGKQWYYDGDPIHFNDAGADRMAECIARALLAADVTGLVPRGVTAEGMTCSH